jgi:hypothetical protein
MITLIAFVPALALIYSIGFFVGKRYGSRLTTVAKIPAESCEPNPQGHSEQELAMLTKYRRGLFKLRTYAHPHYRFVVGTGSALKP